MDARADTELRTASGRYTALHLASAGGFLDAVVALVEGGSDVCALDASGHTPVHHAVQGRNKQTGPARDRRRIVETLVGAGANREHEFARFGAAATHGRGAHVLAAELSLSPAAAASSLPPPASPASPQAASEAASLWLSPRSETSVLSPLPPASNPVWPGFGQRSMTPTADSPSAATTRYFDAATSATSREARAHDVLAQIRAGARANWARGRPNISEMQEPESRQMRATRALAVLQSGGAWPSSSALLPAAADTPTQQQRSAAPAEFSIAPVRWRTAAGQCLTVCDHHHLEQSQAQPTVQAAVSGGDEPAYLVRLSATGNAVGGRAPGVAAEALDAAGTAQASEQAMRAEHRRLELAARRTFQAGQAAHREAGWNHHVSRAVHNAQNYERQTD